MESFTLSCPTRPVGQRESSRGPMTGHAARDMAERLFNPLAGHLNRRKIITVVAWWVFAVLLVGYLRRIWAQRRRGGGEVVRGGGDARELGEGEDGGDYTSLCSLPCFALFLMLVRTVSNSAVSYVESEDFPSLTSCKLQGHGAKRTISQC